jgi:hypothetical protein
MASSVHLVIYQYSGQALLVLVHRRNQNGMADPHYPH